MQIKERIKGRFFLTDYPIRLTKRVIAQIHNYKDNDESFSTPTVNPLSANPTKWSNTLKQFVGNLPTNCLSVFDHFVGLALKGLSVMK